MSGDEALRELLEISEDVVGAVIIDRNGEPLAATVPDDEARRAAGLARGMLAHADSLRSQTTLERLEASTPDGSVFAVRERDRTVVAATGRDPVPGLVYHDLLVCLRKVRGRSRERVGAAS